MSELIIALDLVVAAALFVAGAGKLFAWSSWQDARHELRLGVPRLLWASLPLVELACGAALSLGLRPWGALAALVLFIGFAGALTVSYRRGARGECNCLGTLFQARVGPGTIGRALVLALATTVILVLGDASQPLHPLGLAVSSALAAVTVLAGTVRARVLAQ